MLACVPIGLIAITHRLEALTLLQGADAGEAAQAAFAASIQRYGYGLRIASLFWGLWLLPFGWLVLRSARLPRVLGLLLVLGGIGVLQHHPATPASRRCALVPMRWMASGSAMIVSTLMRGSSEA